MPVTTVAYGLFIRNQDDTADELVLTSLRGGTNPYIVTAPTGDGQRVDPIKGTWSVGSYTVRVADPDLGGGTRVVTSKLADAGRRQQLISRRAYVKTTTDLGATWVVLVAGYVNRVRLVSAAAYEFTVGETQRPDSRLTLFQTTTDTFDQASCLCGGPVRGGFGFIPDYGPWKMQVGAVGAGQWVRLDYVSGFQRKQVNVDLGLIDVQLPGGGYEYVEGGITSVERDRVNAIATGFASNDGRHIPDAIYFRYTDLECRLQNAADFASGTVTGRFTMLDSPVTTPGHPGQIRTTPLMIKNSSCWIEWDGSTGQPAQPAVGTIVYVFVYPRTINENNPIHLDGRPAELIGQVWDAAGVAYSASARDAATLAIGDDLRVALRITQSMTVGDFVTMLCGAFGLGLRGSAAGERELFSTRIRPDATPAVTITADSIRDPGTVPFDVQEATIVNQVTVTDQSFRAWRPSDGATRPIDELVVTPNKVTVSTDDVDQVGAHEVTFDVPGMIYTAAFRRLHGWAFPGTNQEVPLPSFGVALARALFDRRQRGAITGELAILGGAAGSGVAIGDEVVLDLPYFPNNNVRGGQRIVQVLGITPSPSGPTLYCEDAGVSAQPATLPTFTLVKDTATDPKRYALLTITNAAALAAEGDSVRIEAAFGAAPTSWTLMAIIPSDMIGSYNQLRTPRADAGATLNVRLRSEGTGLRPSAYTAPVALTLTALTAPSALASTAVAGDDSRRDLTWVDGEADVPLVVRLRKTADAVALARVVGRLPAGSTQLRLTGLELGVQYTVTVTHEEDPPYAGVSAAASLTFTAGATGYTLAAPANPSAFSGSIDAKTGGLVNDGTYGLEVDATELPSFTIVEEAIETAVGAGTFGSFAEVDGGHVESAQGARTRWTGRAPNDGKERRLRAKQIRTGATDSAYCPTVDVLPWTPAKPTDYPVTPPADFAVTYTTVSSGGKAEARLRCSFTRPDATAWPQYADMEYKVQSRLPTGSYGDFSRVPGTLSGPDLIPAQFGLVYRVIPVTVTVQGVKSEGSAVEVTVPASPASVALTAAGDADSANVTATPSANCTSYRIYAKTYAADPGTVDTVEDPANYVGPDRDPGTTYFEVLFGANSWAVITVVGYERGVRGDYATVKVQQNGAASPPSAPTLTLQTNAPNAVVVRATYVTAPVAGDQLIFKRNGVIKATITLAAGDVTAGHYDWTDTTAVGGAMYAYTVRQKRVSDGLTSADSTALNVTVSSSTLDAPSISAMRDGSDPCGSGIITITAGANNPGDTKYTIESSATGTGSWTTDTTTATAGTNHVTCSTANRFFRATATHAGWTNSAVSSTANLGGSYGGPC